MKKGGKLVLAILITATILGGLSFSKTVTASHSKEHRSTSWTGTTHIERISDGVDEPWSIDEDSTSFPQLLTINCAWYTVDFGYVILAGTSVDRIYNVEIDITISVPSGSNYTKTIDKIGYSMYETGIWYDLGSVTFNLTQADIQGGSSDEIEVYYKYKFTEGVEGWPDYTWSSDFIYMYSIQIGEDNYTILIIISLIVIGVIVGFIAYAKFRKKPPKITEGKAITSEELVESSPKKLYCSKCGAKLLPKSRFCKKCGASVE